MAAPEYNFVEDFDKQIFRIVEEVKLKMDAQIRSRLMAAGWAPPEAVAAIRKICEGRTLVPRHRLAIELAGVAVDPRPLVDLEVTDVAVVGSPESADVASETVVE